jgi:hypothetical protein
MPFPTHAPFLRSLGLVVRPLRTKLWRQPTLIWISLAGFLAINALCQTGSATFSYLSGPNFCQAEYGYTVPAFCTAPGELPLGTFPIPPINGLYIDPNFGASVRLLTDGSTDSVHQYSTPSAFSATGKYVLLSQLNGDLRIVETATAKLVADVSTVTDLSSALWSPTDDDVFYGIGCYPCGGAHNPTQLYKYQVSSQTKTVLIDYATDGHNFSNISFGGTGDLSADNWAAFWARNEHQVCAVDLNLLKTYCADYTAPDPNNRVGWQVFDYVMITRGKDVDTNKRYVLLMATPAMGVYSVNEQTGNLDFEFRGPEKPVTVMGGDHGNHDGVCDPGEDCIATPHADVFADNGRQYLFYDVGVNVPACEDELSSLQISKGIHMLDPVESGGGRKNFFTLFGCGGLTWSSAHFGCARSATASCVVSIYTAEPNLPNQIRDGKSPFDSEVIVVRGNGVEARRLAMHRSVQTEYWDTPRATISPDGSMVLWDSNFGNPANHRVVVAETGFGTTPPGPGCTYTPNTTGLNLVAGPGAGTFTVTPSSVNCAPPSANSTVPWAAASASGNAVNWTVAANTSSQSRTGTLIVGGGTVPIVQSGMGCSYKLSSTIINVGAAASSGVIAVSPSPLDCPAAVASSNVAWASVSVSDNTINWAVTANAVSVPRSGSLNIGGQTISITQQQPLGPPLGPIGFVAVFGTGVTSSGVASDGSVDSHYSIVSSPDGSGPNAYVVLSNSFPIPPWLTNGPNSKWIAPRADAGQGNAAGAFNYRTTFDLTGFNPTTALLMGQFAADNSAIIKLNGVPVGASPGFAVFRPFTISTGFITGVNTLDFLVTNDPYASANPTGLRVEISGTATPVSSGSPIGIYNTGVTASNLLAADFTADPHYTLIASADTGAPGPATYVVNSNVWPIGAWLPDGPNSKWISPSADERKGNAQGTYTYRTTFDLTGFNPTTAALSGQFAADNSSIINLNGVAVGISSSDFSAFTPFTISTGFIAGLNTLDFVVTNAPYTLANPTGLRVEVSGTASR